MPLKRTKSELRVQRDTLKRFQRYLPTLQLKKQQLQSELRQVELQRAELEAELKKIQRERESWVALFAEPLPLADWLSVKKLEIGTQHIAGVDVPVIAQFELEENCPERFEKPVWVDDGLKALREEVTFGVRLEILRQQESLIEAELCTTSQRVNLFEKVKIPEAKENIRIIRIALGDEQVAGVASGKLAKKKNEVAA
ncbi:MAG: V-type ATP synthase subunit D [Kiritimatiellia bacterium]